VNQELCTLPEHPRIHPDFSWVHATRSLVLCTCFVDRCLLVCIFFFGHCVVCFSSIYGLLLPLWYLQSLLTRSFMWDLHGSRFSCLFNAFYICVCAFVLSILSIVLSVNFRLINPVVSSNIFSCEYLKQYLMIYFAS